MPSEASMFRELSGFPLTPADTQGVVDTEATAALIDRLVVAGVDSIAVLGSTRDLSSVVRRMNVPSIDAR